MKKSFLTGLIILSSFYLQAQTEWNTDGNAGTVDSNFLGTTDNRPLILKINNIFSGKMSSTGHVSFGYEACLNNTTTYTNTGIGHQALRTISGGADWSTALGYQAGYSATVDNGTYIGFRAGYLNTTGRSNTAVGTCSLLGQGTTPITGAYNVAVGAFALAYLGAGANNTSVGYGSGSHLPGTNYGSVVDSNCTFLGYYASRDGSIAPSTSLNNAAAIGYNAKVGASNSIILGGTGIDAVKVGIGNIAPANKLEITHGTSGNSGLRFTNLTSSSTAGTSSGKVLSVNSSGDVVLEAASSGSADGSETIINAGTNVTVTGSGTSGSPYVISASVPAGYWDASAIGTGNIINNNTGGVVIGSGLTTLPAGYKLYVASGILTEKLKVALKTSGNWADNVFAKDYRLKPLNEVENFIVQNQHLPGIPSAETLVKDGGIDVTQMLANQMAKIEELTLYLIEINKKMEKLQQENVALKSSVKKIINN